VVVTTAAPIITAGKDRFVTGFRIATDAGSEVLHEVAEEAEPLMEGAKRMFLKVF
jgi:hypothetical protein